MKSTESNDNNTQHVKGDGREKDSLSELFRHASARQRPPAEDEQAIRQALHEQWRGMTRQKQLKRRIWTWAIAASVALATVIGVSLNPLSAPPGPAIQLAFAEKVIGSVIARSPQGSTALQNTSEHTLSAGETLSTGFDSGVALHWVNGALIRVDQRTDIELVSAGELSLVSGRIYVDTAAAGHTGPPITIRTPQGLVRHLGTQFMTRVSLSGTSVSVREGEVVYFPSPDQQDQQSLAGVGQQMAVSVNGEVGFEAVDTWGPEWQWAESLTAGFASDGRSLADLISWAGRETGREVEYHSPAAESVARATVLHGDLDLQPLPALSVASATSDLITRVSDGLILVQLP